MPKAKCAIPPQSSTSRNSRWDLNQHAPGAFRRLNESGRRTRVALPFSYKSHTSAGAVLGITSVAASMTQMRIALAATLLLTLTTMALGDSINPFPRQLVIGDVTKEWRFENTTDGFKSLHDCELSP